MTTIRPWPRSRRHQGGVVLLFALIALLILMLGAAALVRSFNSSLFQAGNIGFKRDMQNRSELVTTVALRAFSDVNRLGTRAARSASSSASSPSNAPQNGNYSATILSVDPQGIPDVLTRQDRRDGTTGFALLPPSNDFDAGDLTTITYVIDRLCASAGDEKVLGSAQCALSQTAPLGTGLRNEQNSDSISLGSASTPSGGNAPLVSSAPISVLYRLSARITGPRNTVSFFQSTFAVPS